jgi:hypothetical protein
LHNLQKASFTHFHPSNSPFTPWHYFFSTQGMKRIFYSIAVLLAIAWIMSFFILHAGGAVHILIFLAVLCWVHAIITMPQKKYMLGNGRISESEGSVEE